MDTLLLIVHGIVVLGAIYLGVREGGVGLGVWGLVGVFVLVYGFHLAPGDPPIDAVFIVVTVITAASAMQAAGGTDWMVSVAANVIRGRPKAVVYLAPLMSFLFTVGAGTGNIFYPLLPVIYDVSYKQRIRPERPLAIAAVASQVGILASPVSAATAALVTLLDHDVIHVAGGNTANMLEVWRLHGVDVALREAWENGAVMTGGSAGGLCWFEGGTTDSFGPDLQPLADGLGFLEGSFCPHYDAEDGRQPLYHQAILDGTVPEGYAVDNLVGLHFRGTELVGAVTSQADGRALRVRIDGHHIVEEPLAVEVLG